MNFAQELQKREVYIDAYLKPIIHDNGVLYQHLRESDCQQFNSLTLSKHGFPIHKLLFAAVSPFFRIVSKFSNFIKLFFLV